MTCVVVGPHWGLLGIHINSRHFKRTEDFGSQDGMGLAVLNISIFESF